MARWQLASLKLPTFAVNGPEDAVNCHGFRRAPRGILAKPFPQPRQAVLGDFLKGNSFRALSVIDDPDDEVSRDGQPLNKPKQMPSTSAYNQPRPKANVKSECSRQHSKSQHQGQALEASTLHSDVPNGTSMEDVQQRHDAYDAIRQSIRDVEAMLREEFIHGESCESSRGEDD